MSDTKKRASPVPPPREQSTPSFVLIVGKQDESRASLATTLRHAGYQVEEASSAKQALAALSSARYDLILTDLSLPDLHGTQLLREARRVTPEIESIVTTSDPGVDRGWAAIEQGAFDLLRKPFSPNRLILTVGHALERRALLARVRLLEEANKMSAPFDGIVGTSRALSEVLEIVNQIARLDHSVLISGERGTGKELIARALHARSPRSDRPFSVIQCDALPDDLRDQGLFGGAAETTNGPRGLLEPAAGGTLYLNGVAALTAADQQDLLRRLQDGPLGAGSALDARVIAATERDLDKYVEAGEFDEDLFYRLNVVSLRVPPLRDRKEDIPLLVRHFLRNAAGRQGGEPLAVSPRAMSVLTSHPWQENVQELESAIDRAVALDRDRVLGLDDLPWLDAETGADKVIDRAKSGSMTLNQLEREYILEVLAECGGIRKKTAAKLGITTATLWRKLKRFERGD